MFEVGGSFVAVVLVEVEVDKFVLVVGCVVRLLLWCSNGRDISCNVLV